jgi:uracil-DNA glycosylase
MNVVFVASNPSVKSSDTACMNVATRSRIILNGWIEEIEANVRFVNVCDDRTEKNRPLTVSEIKSCLKSLEIKLQDCDKIVTLGNTASKAVSMLGLKHLKVPHPSPKNRLLNDKKFVEEIKEKIRDFCS